MKLKVLFFSILIATIVFVAWQYWQYHEGPGSSCGGDWSYKTTCPVGNYCRPLSQGPLAGGTCQPYLSPLFDLSILNKSSVNSKVAKPSPQEPSKVEGQFCGGIGANLPQFQCPTGYKCQLDGNYPDAGGKCVLNENESSKASIKIVAAYPLISSVPPYPAKTQFLVSPNGEFIVENIRSMPGETTIILKTKSGQVITNNLLESNYEIIGYNKKFYCQCDTRFLGWFDSSWFVISIINGASETYEYLVVAKTGKVDGGTFRRVK